MLRTLMEKVGNMHEWVDNVSRETEMLRKHPNKMLTEH